MKSVIVTGLAAALVLTAMPAPAAAQEELLATVLVDICLPYANRAQSFEKSIRIARDLKFRRPRGDQEPLEEFASEIDMISRDGVWRVRIEENTVVEDNRDVYEVKCSISSTRASARELTNFGARAFRDERRWIPAQGNPRRWERRTSRPDEYGLAAEVREHAGGRPTLSIIGSYY